jgi:peroxin-4
MSISAVRLAREFRALQREPDDYIQFVPVDTDSLSKWTCFIHGQPDTPYHGGVWRILVTVPSSYPCTAPTFQMQTQIFHPNIHWRTGEICLDILQSNWSPAWSLMSCARAIQSMLASPAPDSPLKYVPCHPCHTPHWKPPAAAS